MPDAPPQSPIEAYRSAVQANPDSSEAQANLGWGYYGQREYGPAIEAFKQAVALDGQNVDAHYGLGLALKEAGSGQEAIGAFETAIKLLEQLNDPVRASMLNRLANGHINQIRRGAWHLADEGLLA